MLRAFNRSAVLSPVVSVNSTSTPNGHGEEPQATEPPPQQSTHLEAARTSLTINLEEVPTDGGDGASSSIAAGNPLFYAGMMLRGHKGDLVRFFELPPSERLIGDFHCAMRKRVLLQGRMYIFDHYVCFYSAVFGFAKKRRMPMRTIKAVRKRKHLGFPNSLEFETDDCKDFYTSFLSREEAYQLITKQLPEAKRLVDAGEDGSGLRRSTENGSLYNGGGGTGRELSSPRSTTRGGHAEGGARRGGGSGGGIGTRGSGLNGERSLLTRHSGSMGDDDDDEEDSGSVWIMEPRAAPAVASGARHVLHTTLPGSPREFFDVVLADSAPFFEDFLDSQGNRRIHLTSWKRHQQLGHVRDMNFTAPIKGAFGNWGVSHTACFQSQRFCLYSDEHIVFESSQTMTDIPYGDCFTVDQRWDVRRDPDADPDRPMLSFDLHVRVPFTNRCLFKPVIESGSVKQVLETYANFVEQLRPVMQERLLSRNTLNMQDPGEPTLSSTPRLNSSMALGTRSVPLVARSLPHVASMRALTPGGRPAGLQTSSAFEMGDAVDVSLARQSAWHAGGSVCGEPSVGRLMLSLGSRLAEGARSVLESGIDVVLNLTQCRTTPQMRFLVALVILMFLANAVCMLGYMWQGWHSDGGGGATPAAAGEAPGGAADAGLGTAAAPEQLAALLSAGTAGAGGGGGAVDGGNPYLVQRMALLQQEMQLLQNRMEVLSREVAVVLTHLTHGGAAATTGGGGIAGEL